MASATDIPANGAEVDGGGEHEPLLGLSSSTTQADQQPIQHNLILGSGVVAQAGVWILLALVWTGVFSHDLITFSPHPLLNSAAIVLVTQAILILQPTSTPSQKRQGTHIHSALMGLALVCFLTAFIFIEVNKHKHHGVHLKSPHAIMGLVTYILLLVQAFVGVSQFFFPTRVFGTEERAKSVYKWHRMSGYIIVVLLCVTVSAATWTDYNLDVLQIHHWSVILASAISIAGLYARIKKSKIGFESS